MSRSTGTLTEQLAAEAAEAPRELFQVVAGDKPVSRALRCTRCRKSQVLAYGYHALFLWVSDLEAMAATLGWSAGVCLECRLKEPPANPAPGQDWLAVAYNRDQSQRAVLALNFPGPVPEVVALATAQQRMGRMFHHQVLLLESINNQPKQKELAVE